MTSRQRQPFTTLLLLPVLSSPPPPPPNTGHERILLTSHLDGRSHSIFGLSWIHMNTRDSKGFGRNFLRHRRLGVDKTLCDPDRKHVGHDILFRTTRVMSTLRAVAQNTENKNTDNDQITKRSPLPIRSPPPFTTEAQSTHAYCVCPGETFLDN